MVHIIALLLCIFDSLWKRKPYTGSKNKSTDSWKKKKASAKTYEHYEHSTEPEHTTAEQYNWRTQNRISVLTTIFSIAAIVFAFKTFKETQRQAEIAQHQLDLARGEQRAWIAAPTITANLETPKQVTFELTFQNVGKIPTYGLYIGANIVEASVANEEVDRFCLKGRQGAKDGKSYFLKSAILPGSYFLIDELADAHLTVGYTERDWLGFSQPTIAGCVIYRMSSEDGALHRTGFIAQLSLRKNSPQARIAYASGAD